MGDSASNLDGKFSKCINLQSFFYVAKHFAIADRMKMLIRVFLYLDTLKCDRCDSFETISHALLLVHVAQCRGDASSGNSGSSRQQYPMEVTNASNDGGINEDATQSTMDTTSVAASSSTINMNSDSSR